MLLLPITQSMHIFGCSYHHSRLNLSILSGQHYSSALSFVYAFLTLPRQSLNVSAAYKIVSAQTVSERFVLKPYASSSSLLSGLGVNDYACSSFLK